MLSHSNVIRMILYYPVSALVTLFANILQNPQDARVRSDIRLMNQVVNFLSLLSGDEETGGVKRMLGVCSEFERIAKVVLEKSDKDSHTRKKRKSPKDTEEPLQPPLGKRSAQPTQDTRNVSAAPSTGFTPSFTGDLLTSSFAPGLNGYPSPSSTGEMPAMPDFLPGPGDFPNMMTDFSDMQQFGNVNAGSPINVGSFQQPFVPQDLWQMPMTLEWDWADMQGGNNYAGIDGNGQAPFMNGQSPQGSNFSIDGNSQAPFVNGQSPKAQQHTSPPAGGPPGPPIL